MERSLRGVAVFALAVCVLATAGAGCAADDRCPPFAHIVGGDFGRAGNALWWTLQVEQIPTQLLFNQPEVPANFLEIGRAHV